MKSIDSVHLRCIVHATESIDRVKQALRFLVGDVAITVENTKGYYGNDIKILTANLIKQREIRNFWLRLKELGVLDYIIHRLDDIVDSEGNLYLRFDKQEAYEKRISLSTGGDTIAMHAKLLSYPFRKEKAIENFVKYLNSI